MSRMATIEPGKPRTGKLPTGAAERAALQIDDRRMPHELRAALAAIPVDSVTARTAGALRVNGPRYTIEEEREAFERAVAEENAGPAHP